MAGGKSGLLGGWSGLTPGQADGEGGNRSMPSTSGFNAPLQEDGTTGSDTVEATWTRPTGSADIPADRTPAALQVSEWGLCARATGREAGIDALHAPRIPRAAASLRTDVYFLTGQGAPDFSATVLRSVDCRGPVHGGVIRSCVRERECVGQSDRVGCCTITCGVRSWHDRRV